ncbi:MAG: phytanoyl-CoA dioxygenase family protein [Candidatus Latescibacterota bacterium]
MLPRRHREGVLRHYTGGHGGFLEIPVDELHPQGAVPLEMKAGDALFMTNLTPHASFANRTERVRWSLDLRYQSPQAPSNVGEDPARFTAETQTVSMACYPPEADFVIRDRTHPEREVHRAEDFHALRQRYEKTRPYFPGRGWTPMAQRQNP